jgi:hypothetical protein
MLRLREVFYLGIHRGSTFLFAEIKLAEIKLAQIGLADIRLAHFRLSKVPNHEVLLTNV